jgi:bifunctional oligoribonuclease and PAP phosphatase NrnA
MSELDGVVDHLRGGQHFIIASHQRPDGDAIGSAMAAALALRALGKYTDVVFDAPPPQFLQPFPGVGQLRIATRIDETYDGAIIMECGALDRTGVAGLDRSPVLNIDHHLGNTRYGRVNWVDESAAACTELIFSLIERLETPLTREIATHIYLGILTDTGSFHFSHMTPRTFEIARRCVEAGADPQWIARTHYDSSTLGRVKIFGAVLNEMTLDPSGQVAVLTITDALATAAGATLDDTEGLINFPLTVKEIQAVAFFKEMADGMWRVSLRSKGNVDVRAIASQFGGGGHVNAAGCSATGELTLLRRTFTQLMAAAVAQSKEHSEDKPRRA